MSTDAKAADAVRLTEQEFVLRAIAALRVGESRGIHTVYSNFNTAFRKYFGKDADPIAAVDRLVAEGVIVKQFRKGGAVIWKTEEAPPEVIAAIKAKKAKEKKPKKPTALDKILGV